MLERMAEISVPRSTRRGFLIAGGVVAGTAVGVATGVINPEPALDFIASTAHAAGNTLDKALQQPAKPGSTTQENFQQNYTVRQGPFEAPVGPATAKMDRIIASLNPREAQQVNLFSVQNLIELEQKQLTELDVRDTKDVVGSDGVLKKRFQLQGNGQLYVSELSGGLYTQYTALNKDKIPLGSSTRGGAKRSALAVSSDGQRIAVFAEDPANPEHVAVHLSVNGGKDFNKLAYTHKGLFTNAQTVNGSQVVASWNNEESGNSNVDALDLNTGSIGPLKNAGYVQDSLTVTSTSSANEVKIFAPGTMVGGTPNWQGFIESTANLSTKTASGVKQLLTNKGVLEGGFYVDKNASGQATSVYGVSINNFEMYKYDLGSNTVTTISYYGLLQDMGLPDYNGIGDIAGIIKTPGGRIWITGNYWSNKGGTIPFTGTWIEGIDLTNKDNKRTWALFPNGNTSVIGQNAIRTTNYNNAQSGISILTSRGDTIICTDANFNPLPDSEVHYTSNGSRGYTMFLPEMPKRP